MKAIYTKIFNKYYRLDQDTSIPKELIMEDPGVNSSVMITPNNKHVRQSIVINTIDMSIVKSNKEEYKSMIKYISDNKITDMPRVPDAYKVYIDYSVFQDDKEISHDCVIRPVHAVDKIFPLGVSTSSETVYKRVKEIKEELSFSAKIPVPHGIKEKCSHDAKFKIKVNNIIVYLDMFGNFESHESTYETPYGGNTSVVAGNLDTMIPIYSTDTEGYDFGPANAYFKPRTISIGIKIILSNFIVAYNDEEINNLILENVNASCEEVEIPTADTGDDDENGSNENGTEQGGTDSENESEHFIRCESTDSGALIVIEDTTEDESFDSTKMIKIGNVLEDIPDIQIGDYVKTTKVDDYI